MTSPCRGEQAARWLADQSSDVGYKEAARRFGIRRTTVRNWWSRLGFDPLPFPGEVAARWLAEQTGDVGYKEAARRFGLSLEAVRRAWTLLDLGETPRDKMRLGEQARAETAAHWLAEQTGDVGYKEAARRFKLSRHVVQKAWERLALGKTPRESVLHQRHAAVLALARAGKTRLQIQALHDRTLILKSNAAPDQAGIGF